MTDQELQAIRERTEKASRGPWTTDERSGDVHVSTDIVSTGCIAYDVAEDDGVFIAHARTDVPALLAEVERLRAEAARLWASGHMAMLGCADDGEQGGVCVCCGKPNPYRTHP